MPKFLFSLNVLFFSAVIYVLVLGTRRSHTLDPQVLFALVPSATAMLLRKYPNRTLGGVAVVSNGILFVGGLLALTAVALGADATGSIRHQLVLPTIAISSLAVGYLNTSMAWRMFPPKKPTTFPASSEARRGASHEA